MEDRVIPDVMNHVFLSQGRYPENFVLISQLEVCQEWGVKKGEGKGIKGKGKENGREGRVEEKNEKSARVGKGRERRMK